VRPERIVFHPPFFDQYLGLFQGIEDLSIKQLVSELAVETLDITVLPRTARLDKECLHPKPLEPMANHLSRELGSVVRADMLRSTMPDKELRKATQNIIVLRILPFSYLHFIDS
jgi:hypothetical protein